MHPHVVNQIHVSGRLGVLFRLFGPRVKGLLVAAAQGFGRGREQ
jgi:hypothetical protein